MKIIYIFFIIVAIVFGVNSASAKEYSILYKNFYYWMNIEDIKKNIKGKYEYNIKENRINYIDFFSNIDVDVFLYLNKDKKLQSIVLMSHEQDTKKRVRRVYEFIETMNKNRFTNGFFTNGTDVSNTGKIEIVNSGARDNKLNFFFLEMESMPKMKQLSNAYEIINNYPKDKRIVMLSVYNNSIYLAFTTLAAPHGAVRVYLNALKKIYYSDKKDF